MRVPPVPVTEDAGRECSRAAHTLVLFLLVVIALHMAGWAAAPSSAAVPLLQPTSVAYDTAGNLFFAESRNNVVRRLAPDGTLETVAGTAVQGFAGDGGDALAAELDAPRGVALDGAQNLYIADTHNNRVRRVDARTHVITTIAGTGAAGFAGDGGPAGQARLRAPLALALDAAQHLFVADSGNHRVRSIDLGSGVISTVAGDGRQGFSGDGGPAALASFDTPSGLVLDATGDLFIADAGNRRVREVSSASRQVVTVAGATGMAVPLSRPEGLTLDARGGLLISDAGNQCVYLLDLASGRLSVIAGRRIQAFGGDHGMATLAMLDTPRGVAVAPNGDVAIADSGNARVRLVSEVGDQTISTVAGLGSRLPGALLLSGATEQTYGAAAVSVRLPDGDAASGPVSLGVVSSGREPQVVAATFQAGVARFDLSLLPAGTYQLTANWAGDAAYQAASSAPSAITVRPVSLTMQATDWSMVYGSTPPAVAAANLSGVLAQDQGRVSLSVALPAVTPLVPGSYPLALTLAGPAAGNYVLPETAGQLIVSKAPVRIALTQSSGDLLASVKSTTSGVPGGAVTLFDSAGGSLGAFPVDATGSATLSMAGMSPGVYTMSAVYSGDADFLAAQSSPQQIQIGGGGGATPAPASDFVLSSVGSGSVSVPSGGSAVFSLQVRPTGDALSSPILLNVAGLPLGATASFSPGLIPPGGAATVATLTVQLPRSAKVAAQSGGAVTALAAGLLCPLFLLSAVRGRLRSCGLLGFGLALALPFTLAGCGDRVAATSASVAAPKIYSLVVSATTTLANGSALQHSTSLALTVP